jgi:hypothetical protein
VDQRLAGEEGPVRLAPDPKEPEGVRGAVGGRDVLPRPPAHSLAGAATAEVLAALARLEGRVAELHELLLTWGAGRDWLTTADVAKLVGGEEFTVREWCRPGRLRAAKKGSGRGTHAAWAVSREELARYRCDSLLPDRRA